jgi:hypothetical protein
MAVSKSFTTVEEILHSLEDMYTVINVPENIRIPAATCWEK